MFIRNMGNYRGRDEAFQESNILSDRCQFGQSKYKWFRRNEAEVYGIGRVCKTITGATGDKPSV